MGYFWMEKEENGRLTESSAVDGKVIVYEKVKIGTCVWDAVREASNVFFEGVGRVAARSQG